ncbi:hypothetical protein CJ030_MR3G020092 [Morella rubra]|uniref:Uncharacterized protein n=1 Tax=Morella rubra TaxID=262757 RepID=A0A6A1W4E3_9ROSI|nr:hypothetical protein CJ030_MR3G020092 [Morella rubra]
MAAQSSAAPGPTPPPTPNPNPSPGSWIGVAVGIFATVILPFLANKMGTFLKLNQEVEAVVETAEVATEVIEKVAEEVEKLAEEVANQFPEGGKVQNAATFVENIAKETIKDAHLAEDVIEKVEEVEKEVESFVDPAIHQVNKLLKEANDHKN